MPKLKIKTLRELPQIVVGMEGGEGGVHFQKDHGSKRSSKAFFRDARSGLRLSQSCVGLLQSHKQAHVLFRSAFGEIKGL